MIGAIAGDIIGSVYEWKRIKHKDFPIFQPACTYTDDSVLTIAVAKAILEDMPYGDTIRELGRKYPDSGYGGFFFEWLYSSNPQPYNSWGNGSAMRVSPIGFVFQSVEEVLAEARKSAEITHDHPEGIKGAQATALAIYLARMGESKEIIESEVSNRFKYDLRRTIDEIRPRYQFDESCQGTMPEAIIAFLESKNYEDAIRNAISLGGDSDTLACITGGIAQAFYGEVPSQIIEKVKEILDDELLFITNEFCQSYGITF